MPARFATERYSIQSNNGNPKSTTAKTSTKIKIEGSPKCIGKKGGTLGNAHSAIKLLTDNMLSLTTKIIQH